MLFSNVSIEVNNKLEGTNAVTEVKVKFEEPGTALETWIEESNKFAPSLSTNLY